MDTNIWNQLDTLELQPGEIFADAIAIGQSLSEDQDARAIQIGQLGLILTRKYKGYGKKIVRDFADQTGIKRSTCYQYMNVVRFFGMDDLRNYLVGEERDTLTFSHFREAARLKQKSTAWTKLFEWRDNTTKPEQAHLEVNEALGRENPPATIVPATEVLVVSVEASGRVTFDLQGYALDMQEYQGKLVQISVKEVPSEDET